MNLKNKIFIFQNITIAILKMIYLGDITCQNINYSYGKKIIFENLNLKINKNSIFGISGESGSGKSTLINILLGLLKPDKGKSFS